MPHVRALEVWRPILGFEGAYEVSNCGGVRSLDRVVRYVDGRSRNHRGRVLTPFLDDNGYRRVDLLGDYHKVHILVLETFVCPRPAGLLGLHADDNKWNNRLSNLRWGTYVENLYDSVRNRTHHMVVRTSCPRGHLLAEPNLVEASLPRRTCKACNRARGYFQHRGVRNAELLQSKSDEFYASILAKARG